MSSIDIRTTQQVSITYELAGLGDRAVAFMIDVLILLVFFGLITWAFWGVFRISDESILFIWLRYVPLMLFFLYFFLLESIYYGQTPGKLLMKLQVVRADGADLQPGDLALRALFHLVDTLGSLGTLGALLVATSPRQQRIGDMASGCVVIRTKPSRPLILDDILGISSREGYQAVFEDVRQLSEADMLVIKNALSRYQQHPSTVHRDVILHLSRKMAKLLGVDPGQMEPVAFLKTLLQDYIVLTR